MRGTTCLARLPHRASISLARPLLASNAPIFPRGSLNLRANYSTRQATEAELKARKHAAVLRKAEAEALMADLEVGAAKVKAAAMLAAAAAELEADAAKAKAVVEAKAAAAKAAAEADAAAQSAMYEKRRKEDAYDGMGPGMYLLAFGVALAIKSSLRSHRKHED